MSFTLIDIDRLIRGKLGRHDVPCPLCGPDRRSPANRRRPVLRIWRELGWASFCCLRCGEDGWARDASAPRADPEKLARVRAELAAHELETAAERLRVAQWLWCHRRPITGTIAETYLRGPRAYRGPIPTTLGFLPSRGDHPPAMIAAFGFAEERAPGVVAIADDQIRGVLLTRLAADGSGKAGTDRDKIMIGRSTGSPIVLAPANDLLGLAVTEGIEDGLSVFEATGLGAWAAGAASRLPALADRIPSFVECVSILVDDDEAGRRHAAALAERLHARGVAVRRVVPSAWRAAA